MGTARKLEVILKIAEVCNIACTYCYYFFSGDSRPEVRPRAIQSKTISDLVGFLEEGYRDGLMSSVQIDLHGGEPTMVGKRKFSEICNLLTNKMSVPSKLCLTTNAMLIDDHWIDLFAQFNVSTCVSVDGPEDVHDGRREGKRGEPTYRLARSGIDRLLAAGSSGYISPISALCVVDFASSASRVYEHIVKDIGIKTVDFLMPDVTFDTFDGSAELAERYMDELMSVWLADDDVSVDVRILKSVLSLLVANRTYLAGFGSAIPYAITVGSDGTIDGDDFLKPCGADVISTGRTLSSSSLREVLNDPLIINVCREIETLPTACRSCEFAGACGGGQATHRFSRSRRFDNPSVYCAALKTMFYKASKHLVRTGVSPEIIAACCRA